MVNRLTEHYGDNSGYGPKDHHPCEERLYIDLDAYEKCVNKLGRLEDIEEELGFSIELLHKILKEGIYVQLFDYSVKTIKKVNVHFYNFDFKKQCIDIKRYDLYFYGHCLTGGHQYFFKDYGKTWSLSRWEF